MVRAEEGVFIKSKGNPSVFRGQTWSLGQGATCPAWGSKEGILEEAAIRET